MAAVGLGKYPSFTASWLPGLGLVTTTQLICLQSWKMETRIFALGFNNAGKWPAHNSTEDWYKMSYLASTTIDPYWDREILPPWVPPGSEWSW